MQLAIAVPVGLVLAFLSVGAGVGIIRNNDEQTVQAVGIFVLNWGTVISRWIYRWIRGS